MSTAVADKPVTSKKNVLFASKAEAGRDYITAKGNKVLVVEQKGSTTGVKVYTQGYKVKDMRVLYLANTTLLEEIAGGGIVKKTEKAQAKPEKKPEPKQATKQKAPATPKKDRIEKLKPGEKLPTLEVDGTTYRANYRCRLSGFRAKECEAAKKDSCRCRCAGSLHGKSHKAWFEAENELFLKSPNGAITGAQVAKLVKQFGGAKHQEAKPKKAAKPSVKK